jgi:hydroxypyruvate isomerase
MCWLVKGSHEGGGCAMITNFTLAACAEMIFTELPITERVRRIDDLGFR